ncbi:hypothetical protein INS49_003671 [Diaporthe citri]|uniref:uncharacterized protein n=1 Tax=Diaporthe citri TaxID=83186 RepID=UPI001C81DBAE|nr:uncharacterized protein INS49_003671 [Diaporthe citri]KAG6355707.1 hypothetical protein INS49_003671 [Diaporthe citri]
MAPRPFRLVVGVPRDDTIEPLTPTTTQPQSVAPMTARYQPDRTQGDAHPECHAYPGRSDVEALMSRKLQRSRHTSTSQEGIWDCLSDFWESWCFFDRAAIDAVIDAAIGAVTGAVTGVVIDVAIDGPRYASKYAGGGRRPVSDIATVWFC